jgi:hypothetical protein
MRNAFDANAQNRGGSPKIDFQAIRTHFPRDREVATSRPLAREVKFG